MGNHSCMLHSIFVLCCCFYIVLTVKANMDDEATQTNRAWRVRKHAQTNTLSNLYEEESLKIIFSRYGKNGIMDYNAFKDFLKNLGLGEEVGSHEPHLEGDDHDKHDHADHDHGEHDHAGVQRIDSVQNEMENTHDAINQCLAAEELYKSLEKNSSNEITKQDILTMCPVLLHQLDSQACKHEHKQGVVPAKQVWGYGFASVTIISLISIAGILVVPCTKRYPALYTNLISFLVAVAIGALMGDALLHLLPHSYGIHSHEGHAEEEEAAIKASTVVWRGTVSVAGILLFFICEKLMHFLKGKESNKKKSHSGADDIDADKPPAAEPLINHNQPRMSGCNSLPQVTFKRPSLQKNHNDAHLLHIHNDTQIHQLFENSDIPMVKMECGEDTCDIPCEDSSCPEAKCENQEQGCVGIIDNDVRICNSDPIRTEIKDDDNEVTKSLGHGHSHKHSHGHSHDHAFSGGIATVAWMVIMGDGLHNFCDGIAIGAAFANSITGGVSTSIAIFCHELPHEVGDFAVMLKSGMSVKKALAYMGLSSFLAYIGMILGVAIGNIEEANLWIFAVTGGIFLYIALVDLLPELLESTDVHIHTLLLQTFGITFGISIMIVIGLYEETIQQAID